MGHPGSAATHPLALVPLLPRSSRRLSCGRSRAPWAASEWWSATKAGLHELDVAAALRLPPAAQPLTPPRVLLSAPVRRTWKGLETIMQVGRAGSALAEFNR